MNIQTNAVLVAMAAMVIAMSPTAAADLSARDDEKYITGPFGFATQEFSSSVRIGCLEDDPVLGWASTGSFRVRIAYSSHQTQKECGDIGIVAIPVNEKCRTATESEPAVAQINCKRDDGTICLIWESTLENLTPPLWKDTCVHGE